MRKIGNWINPQTGETDWFEPECVNQILLRKKLVLKVGDTIQSSVDFILTNNNDNKTINLQAVYKADNKTFSSDVISEDEMEFAESFVRTFYKDEDIDDNSLVVSMKDKAMLSITTKLMEAGILLGGMKFQGIGFIKVEGDKVISIDSMDFDYSVENNTPKRTLHLHNCVGQAQLERLENYEIVFYTKDYVVKANKITIVKAEELKVKQYEVIANNFTLEKKSEMPEHKGYSLDLSNDDAINEFIANRKTLLNEGIAGTEFEDIAADIEDLF